MTQDKYAYIYNKVKDALEKDKLFLHPELSLSMLCRVVGTNTVYLSKAINNGFKCSYSQLVNRYRINHLIAEAKRTGENIAVIAARRRFWSRSTFFDVFRKQTGMTPHRYMEKLTEEANATTTAKSDNSMLHATHNRKRMNHKKYEV